ncbi:hypothetical protein ACVWY0_001088 [Arthrobacter sp. UYNi723]
MSRKTYTLNSVYRPTEGTGIIHITFHDLRMSTRKNAEELLNRQLAAIMQDRPANVVVTAGFIEEKRFGSRWSYALSTVTPTQAVHPPSRTNTRGALQHV